MNDKTLTLSLAETAKILGISRTTAYNLVAKNEFPIPILRIGKQIKVSRKSVDDFLHGASSQAVAS